MWFASEIPTKARQGKLELDCQRIELSPNPGNPSRIYRGNGCIKQNEQGDLVFKLFAQGIENIKEFTILYDQTNAGELYEDRHYFTLTATDFWGNRWKSVNVIPEFHPSAHVDPPSLVLTGKIFQLEATQETDLVYACESIKMFFYQEIDIPFNMSTLYYDAPKVEEPEIRKSVRDRAEFHAGGCDFVVRKVDELTTITVESRDSFPPEIQLRILESLLFVLGRPLMWREIEHLSKNKEILVLRSPLRIPEPIRLKPPIRIADDFFLDMCWYLFKLYFEYILDYPKSEMHRCSSYLFSASEASACSPDTHALNLAVAIDGIVKTLYGDLGRRGKEYIDCVDALRDYALTWEGLRLEETKTLGLDKASVSGAIGNLKHVRPQDVMRILANQGFLIKEHIPIWNKLRNTKAHALDNNASPDRQKLFRDIDTVTVLLYHIIFNKIGYQGFYND